MNSVRIWQFSSIGPMNLNKELLKIPTVTKTQQRDTQPGCD